MRDQELVKALREHADWWENGDMMDPLGGLEKDLFAAADRLENQNAHIAALQQEIEKLRGQVPRWILVTERLPATELWGASKLVLGIVQNESGYPPPNPCFCVYLGNQKWMICGRMATITHWMPLPEPSEVENAETE